MNFSTHIKFLAIAIGPLPNKPLMHHHIITVYVHDALVHDQHVQLSDKIALQLRRLTLQ